MVLNFWPVVSTHCMVAPPFILSAEHRFIKEFGIIIKESCYGTKNIRQIRKEIDGSRLKYQKRAGQNHHMSLR